MGPPRQWPIGWAENDVRAIKTSWSGPNRTLMKSMMKSGAKELRSKVKPKSRVTWGGPEPKSGVVEARPSLGDM